MRACLAVGAAVLFPFVVLAAIVVPNVLVCIDCGNQAWTAKTDLVGLGAALEDFAEVHDGSFPDALRQLVVPDANGERFLNQGEVPLDPWGRPFLYAPAADRRGFRLGSLGADGLPGGEGEDADLDLHELTAGIRARRAAAIPRVEPTVHPTPPTPLPPPDWRLDRDAPLPVRRPPGERR